MLHKVFYTYIFFFRINGLIDQCTHDLVPLYRSQLWASLLGINFDTQDTYDKIDKVQTFLLYNFIENFKYIRI